MDGITQAVFGDGFARRVGLYVPSTADVDVPLESVAAERLIERVGRSFSEIFGGATVIPARGFWVAEGGKLVGEPIALVYSNASELTIADLTQVRDLAIAIRDELTQESIAVEVDGVLYFV